jgi:hypothetical protein
MPENKRSTAVQTKAVAKRPTIGRPSVYSLRVANVILDRLAGGELLSAICLRAGMPKEKTVRGWVVDNRDSFAERYARAVQMGLDRQGEGMLSIADDSSSDMTLDKDGRVVVNHEHIRRSEVRIRTRQWLLERRLPHIYGQKIEQQITGTFEVGQRRPDLSNLSSDELASFEVLMAKAVAKP